MTETFPATTASDERLEEGHRQIKVAEEDQDDPKDFLTTTTTATETSSTSSSSSNNDNPQSRDDGSPGSSGGTSNAADAQQCSIQQNPHLCTYQLLQTVPQRTLDLSGCDCYAFCDGTFVSCQSSHGGIVSQVDCPSGSSIPVGGCYEGLASENAIVAGINGGNSSTNSNKSMSAGGIAAIVIVVPLCIGALLYLLVKKKRRPGGPTFSDKEFDTSDQEPTTASDLEFQETVNGQVVVLEQQERKVSTNAATTDDGDESPGLI